LFYNDGIVDVQFKSTIANDARLWHFSVGWMLMVQIFTTNPNESRPE
jgi:hypothetical protein